MSDFDMSQAHFKSAAKRLRAQFEEMGHSISHQSSLQTLSQILFAKPYEEILSEVLTKDGDCVPLVSESGIPVAPHVVILNYGRESILVVNRNYRATNAPGTDMELSDFAFQTMADSVARSLGVEIQEHTLPSWLNEDYECDDVVLLGEVLGLLNDRPFLPEAMLNEPLRVVGGEVTGLADCLHDLPSPKECGVGNWGNVPVLHFTEEGSDEPVPLRVKDCSRAKYSESTGLWTVREGADVKWIRDLKSSGLI